LRQRGPRKSIHRAVLGGVALAAVALAAPGARAFQFDVWKSRSGVEKVLEGAKDKGMALETTGGGLFSKPSAEDLALKVEYEGKTKLMGYSAKLLFSFSPESKVLHTLRVEMSVPRAEEEAGLDVLADTVARQLDGKYKDRSEGGSGGLLDQLTEKFSKAKRRTWRGGADVVTMESSWGLMGGTLLLVYTDEKTVEKAQAEERRLREKRLEKTGGKDLQKF